MVRPRDVPSPRLPWQDSPWRIVGAAVSAAVTVTLIAAVALLVVVPRVVGGAALTVLSGSMEPAFAAGDVIVVRGVDEATVCRDVGVGEVVTYFPEPGVPDLITHRVVGKTVGTFDDGTSCRLVVQGDANSSPDAPISPAQVRGTFLFGIPRLGWVREWVVQHPQTMLIAAGAVVALYFAWGGLRPRTRVTYVPASAAAHPGADGRVDPPSPEPLADARAWEAAIDPETYAVELELRRRELAVREREVAVREWELEALLDKPLLSAPEPPPEPEPEPAPGRGAGDPEG